MATAICSALTGVKVRHDIAMTGEITLRGNVLPIGGLKEKAIAAYKNGIKSVIIPSNNTPDIDEVDPVVREKVRFIPVNTIDEVLDLALINKTVNSNKSKKASATKEVKVKNRAINSL